MPKFSLIIPTRRGGEELTKTIDSIVDHTNDFEVIPIAGEAGFATKLNEGIKKAKGDYLIFLHDDCEVTKGWTDDLVEVGAFCVGENNDSFEIWGGFNDPDSYCTDPTQHPDYDYFCCIHKDAMKKIGLFDERYENPWYQDCDMGMQIRKAGFYFKCLDGKIIHKVGDKSGEHDLRQEGYFKRKWGIDG